MTRNLFDARDEIEDLIDEAVLIRAMPGWGEEVWQDGRIINGEYP